MKSLPVNSLLFFLVPFVQSANGFSPSTSARLQKRLSGPLNDLETTALSASVPNTSRGGNSEIPSRLLSKSTIGACLAAFAAAGVASSVEVSSMKSAVGAFYKSSPFLAAFTTCGTIASAADFVAQRRDISIEKNAETPSLRKTLDVDPRRTLAFLLYGGLYQGVCQEFIYNRLFPVIFGSGTGASVVLGKVAADMLVLTPLLCLPLAYVVKSLVFGRSFQDAIVRYSDDVMNKALLLRFWGLW
eukprot:CAMPEP_0183292958 /NCGR_PEP_ID=MMETSP0160_2-20130417/1832_1 /TAXON_ID=2839 ORGANISM="Odontella Sinensis, Strain Grunow 1884" /NCGR_SAMPLE_ID=MMETSP0160_2 /ASSEMBLY_ACC=CAM_ASM_000250 /LENGTH=243 /DNA_ID=CAMNT_0025454003 /DNA_START=119 /DNA_END=847 /DNA_ORIENTATION=+